nr:leucine-rich repeat domain-containing protein [Eubacterium sp.]
MKKEMKQRIAWILVWVLLVLCMVPENGVAVRAAEDVAVAEGDIESGSVEEEIWKEEVKELDANNLDEDGWEYELDEKAQTACLINFHQGEMSGILELRVPDYVIEEGVEYPIIGIDFSAGNEWSEKQKADIYLGKFIESVNWSYSRSCNIAYYVHSDNTHLVSENGSLYDDSKTIMYHFNSRCYGNTFTFCLPETIEKVEEWAFYYATIQEVVLPENISELPQYAFANSYIKRMDLKNVERIGYKCFCQCYYLEELRINRKNTVIEELAFSENTSLQYMYLPEGTDIGHRAFYRCYQLKRVIMEKGCLLTGADIFHGCYNLELCVLPEDLVEIPEGTFVSCVSLEQICLPETVQSVREEDFKGAEVTLLKENGLEELQEITERNSDIYINVWFGNKGECGWRETTFFAYDTWGVTGMYCEKCRGGIDFQQVEISENSSMPDELSIPVYNTTGQEVELDENSMDLRGLFYELDDESGTASVVDYDDGQGYRYGYVEIPLSVQKDGFIYKVRSIGKNAISNAQIVILSDHIVTIEDHGIVSVKEVVLGKKVQNIGENALGDVGKITVDEENPFFVCRDNVLYDSSMTRLVKAGNQNIKTELYVAEEVTGIVGYSFWGYAKERDTEFLKIYVQNADFVQIDEEAFTDCGAQLVNVKSGVMLDEECQDSQGRVYDLYPASYDDSYAVFRGYATDKQEEVESSSEIHLPKRVEKDGVVYAVSEINILEEDVIPKTKDTILWHIHKGIKNVSLTGLCKNRNIYFETEEDSENFITKDGSLLSGDGKQFYYFYDGSCATDTMYEMPDSVEEVKDYAFYQSQITSIDLKNVTKIGRYAFYECMYLKEVRLNRGVSINWNAFTRNISLDSIYLPPNSKLMNPNVFYQCYSLKVIVADAGTTFDSDTSFMDHSFAFCNNLQCMILPETLEVIPSYMMYHDFSLRKLYVPDSIKELGEHCFQGMRTVLYGNEDSVVKQYMEQGDATLQWKSLSDHIHELKEVSYIRCETWALTGKYCEACGYGTDFHIVDILGDSISHALPAMISLEETIEDCVELDLENQDVYGLVYQLDEKQKTASVIDFVAETTPEGTPTTNLYVHVPSKVLKDGVKYIVTAIREDGARNAQGLWLPDSIQEVEPNAIGGGMDYLYLGANTQITQLTTTSYSKGFWEVPIQKIEVSERNPYYMASGNALLSKDGTTFMKYGNWLEPQESGGVYVVPKTVTRIKSGAFSGSGTYLNEICIYDRPDLVIEPDAFEDCQVPVTYLEYVEEGSPEGTFSPTPTPQVVQTPAPVVRQEETDTSVPKSEMPMITESEYEKTETAKEKSSAKSSSNTKLHKPKISVRKGVLRGTKYVEVRLKKYQGKYVEIYISLKGRKFKKLKLVSSKISKYKGRFKIRYMVKKQTIRFKVRTYKKKGKKKIYSKYSKIVKIRV